MQQDSSRTGAHGARDGPSPAIGPLAYAAGMTERRLATLPNLISAARLASVPVFCWLVLGADERVAAGCLLAVLGASDWVDGYVARRLGQVSEIGKVLDPTADRIVLLAAGATLLVDGSVPIAVGVVVLVREAAVSLAVLGLAAAGARRIDVQWVGKAGTLLLMFAFPVFLFAESTASWHDTLRGIAWALTAVGIACSYVAAFTYLPAARRALQDGRAARDAQALTA